MSPALTAAVAAATVLLTGRALAQKEVSARAPNGDLVTTASGKSIQVFDKKQNKLVWRVKAGFQADVVALRYAPDGKTLAAGDKDGCAYVHNAATGATVWAAPNFNEKRASGPGVILMRFSQDGKLLAYADEDGLVTVRGAPEGKLLWQTKTGLKGISELTFSPDGKKVTAKAGESMFDSLKAK